MRVPIGATVFTTSPNLTSPSFPLSPVFHQPLRLCICCFLSQECFLYLSSLGGNFLSLKGQLKCSLPQSMSWPLQQNVLSPSSDSFISMWNWTMNPTGASGRVFPPGFNSSLPLKDVQLFVKSHQKQGILLFHITSWIMRYRSSGSAVSLQQLF